MTIAILLTGLILTDGATASPPASPRPRYVSMGSSYAAGPGVGIPDPASGGCARSMSNYARRLAETRNLLLVDVSCSGATTENILVEGQYGFPPQIEAVTPDTALMSILIGGNDIRYVGNLAGLSCRDMGGRTCNVTDDAGIAGKLAALPAKLDHVLSEVRRRAPAARIVLVDYLPAVPATGDKGCPALPLSRPDILRIRAMTIRLAKANEAVAAKYGAHVIRSMRIGARHDVCSPTPFVAGQAPPRNASWPNPVPYHPNQAGMDGVASALETWFDDDQRRHATATATGHADR